MNGLDKTWLKALKYFADNTRAWIIALKEDDEKEFRKILPKDLEDTFIEYKYLDFKGKTKYIITQEGLQELRNLEQYVIDIGLCELQ